MGLIWFSPLAYPSEEQLVIEHRDGRLLLPSPRPARFKPHSHIRNVVRAQIHLSSPSTVITRRHHTDATSKWLLAVFLRKGRTLHGRKYKKAVVFLASKPVSGPIRLAVNRLGYREKLRRVVVVLRFSQRGERLLTFTSQTSG